MSLSPNNTDPTFPLPSDDTLPMLPAFRLFEVMAYDNDGRLGPVMVTAHAYDVNSPAGHLVMVDVDLQGRTWHRRTFHYLAWRGIREMAQLAPSKGVN